MGNFWGIIFGLMLICFGLGAVAGINVWKYFFPVFLILLGLSILFNQTKGVHTWQGTVKPAETQENMLEYSVVFNGIDKKVITNDFQGGKISVVFGGISLDLRNAKIVDKRKVTLEINTVFGGVKIIIPKDWQVQGNLSGVFGGFDNSTTLPEKPLGTLLITGSAVFGGGEITN